MCRNNSYGLLQRNGVYPLTAFGSVPHPVVSVRAQTPEIFDESEGTGEAVEENPPLAEKRLVIRQSCQIGQRDDKSALQLTLLLRMDDQMNRQLQCEFSKEETPKSLADELVMHGFINEVWLHSIDSESPTSKRAVDQNLMAFFFQHLGRLQQDSHPDRGEARPLVGHPAEQMLMSAFIGVVSTSRFNSIRPLLQQPSAKCIDSNGRLQNAFVFHPSSFPLLTVIVIIIVNYQPMRRKFRLIWHQKRSTKQSPSIAHRLAWNGLWQHVLTANHKFYLLTPTIRVTKVLPSF